MSKVFYMSNLVLDRHFSIEYDLGFSSVYSQCPFKDPHEDLGVDISKEKEENISCDMLCLDLMLEQAEEWNKKYKQREDMKIEPSFVVARNKNLKEEADGIAAWLSSLLLIYNIIEFHMSYTTLERIRRIVPEIFDNYILIPNKGLAIVGEMMGVVVKLNDDLQDFDIEFYFKEERD